MCHCWSSSLSGISPSSSNYLASKRHFTCRADLSEPARPLHGRPAPTGTFLLWAFRCHGVVWPARAPGVDSHPVGYRADNVSTCDAIVVLLLVPAIGWFLIGSPPLEKSVPVLGRFNFEGGMRLTPEFAALLVGLVVYTGAFIAEVIRAGILAVQKGQVEAAKAIGLKPLQSAAGGVAAGDARIIPPLISQYLNLIKNSACGCHRLCRPVLRRPDDHQPGRASRAVFLMIMAATWQSAC